MTPTLGPCQLKELAEIQDWSSPAGSLESSCPGPAPNSSVSPTDSHIRNPCLGSWYRLWWSEDCVGVRNWLLVHQRAWAPGFECLPWSLPVHHKLHSPSFPLPIVPKWPFTGLWPIPLSGPHPWLSQTSSIHLSWIKYHHQIALGFPMLFCTSHLFQPLLHPPTHYLHGICSLQDRY